MFSFLHMDVPFSLEFLLQQQMKSLQKLKNTPSDVNLFGKKRGWLSEWVPGRQPVLQGSLLFPLNPKEGSCLKQLLVKTLMCIRIPWDGWERLLNVDADSAGLRWGPRVCISNELLGDAAAAAGPGIALHSQSFSNINPPVFNSCIFLAFKT